MIYYWSFISYSRKDELWAKKLHKKLEAYRIERAIWNDVYEPNPNKKRMTPVFLDSDELSASSDLDQSLKKTLEQSSSLVVICSPDSARSLWVQEEIEYFNLRNSKNRVFPVIIRGKAVCLKSGSQEGEEAFPTNLSPDQNPLWIDFRRGAEPENRAFLRLVAGILNVRFDVLWKREKRRRLRRLLLSALFFICFVGILALFYLWMGFTTWRNDLTRQAESSLELQYELGYDKELDIESRRALVAALPSPGSLISTFDSAADLALIYGLTARIYSTDSVGIEAMCFSPDGHYLVIAVYGGDLYVLNIHSDDLVASIRDTLCNDNENTIGNECTIVDIHFDRNSNKMITLSYGGKLTVWSVRTWEKLFEIHINGTSNPAGDSMSESLGKISVVDSNTDRIYIVTDDGIVHVVDTTAGLVTEEIMLHENGIDSIAVSSNGNTLIAASPSGDYIHWANFPHEQPAVIKSPSHLSITAISPDGMSFFDSGLTHVTQYNSENLEIMNEFHPENCGEPIQEDGDEFFSMYDALFYCNADAVAITNDGSTLIAGYDGSNIEIWDMDSNHPKEPVTLGGHEQGISCIAVNDAGTYFASGALDGIVKVWPLIKKIHQMQEIRLAIAQSVKPGELRFSEDDWLNHWQLRIRHPDPSKWRGILSVQFWKDLPANIFQAVKGNYPDK